MRIVGPSCYEMFGYGIGTGGGVGLLGTVTSGIWFARPLCAAPITLTEQSRRPSRGSKQKARIDWIGVDRFFMAFSCSWLKFCSALSRRCRASINERECSFWSDGVEIALKRAVQMAPHKKCKELRNYHAIYLTATCNRLGSV